MHFLSLNPDLELSWEGWLSKSTLQCLLLLDLQLPYYLHPLDRKSDFLFKVPCSILRTYLIDYHTSRSYWMILFWLSASSNSDLSHNLKTVAVFVVMTTFLNSAGRILWPKTSICQGLFHLLQWLHFAWTTLLDNEHHSSKSSKLQSLKMALLCAWYLVQLAHDLSQTQIFLLK